MIEPETTNSVLGTLGINGVSFIAQLVNFSIVVFAMWKWVYKPLLKTMDHRAKEITDGLKNAKEAKKNLDEANIEKEKILGEARVAGHTVIEDAQSKAEALRQDKIVQTKQEIEKIIGETKEKIANEREESFKALKVDIADLIALATEKVAVGLDKETQRKLIDGAIKEIEAA